MFKLCKANAIGEDENCNEEFVKQSLWQYMTTPFKGSEDCPELDIDSILEEVTKSMRDIAFYLKYDTVEAFLQMVDLAVVDLAITKQNFKSETDVRTQMLCEDDSAKTSERRMKVHGEMATLISDIIAYHEENPSDEEEEED
jgi:hypothetical protein